ncbi:MAG: DNA internalization-related competence protein ComEC/Rec2 [Caldiserica bacterium]|nr:DNA internalization-related competence protein ComEC/Rec2 [Caldisericota bacterium]
MKNALTGRPLFLWVFLFIIGEVLGFYLGLPFFALFLFLFSLTALFFLIPKLHLPWLFLLLSLALPLGYYLSFSASHPQSGEPSLDLAWGVVDSDPKIQNGRANFFLRVFLIEKEGEKKEENYRFYVISLEEQPPERGDLLKVSGRIKAPKEEISEYLRKERCFWILRSSQIEKLGTTLTPLGEFFRNLKLRIEKEIDSLVPYPENEFLTGVLIGRAANLEESATLPFKETGTSHILAASGTNVALLVAFFLITGRLLSLRRRTALIISIPFVLIYATLCGWLPSITRATVVVLVGILSMLIRREKDFPTTLAFAALVILLFDPLALFFLDFQLSFLATACLAAFVPEMQNWIPGRAPKALKDSLFAAISSQVGVAPLIASQFHNLPLIAPLANMIILPIISVLLPAGLLSVSFSLFLPEVGRPLIWLVGQGAILAYNITKGLGAVPLANLIVPSAPSWLQWIYWGALFLSLGIALLGFKEKTRALATRLMALVFLIFVVWVSIFPVLFPVQFFEAHFIDVGQGDSILLRTPDRINLLWDAGGNSKSLRYLQNLGVNSLDLVFISHSHSDHLNGFFSILDNIPVKMVLLNQEDDGQGLEKLKEELRKRGIPYAEVKEGYFIKTDLAQMRILAPPEEAEDWKINDRSLVGKFSFGETDVLLAGDIENKGRDHLKEEGGIDAEILKVPHHGSATSLDKEFLEMVSPLVAVISVGKDNPYGHPSQVTLELLKEVGLWTLETSRVGSVVVQSDGKFITIEKAK